MLNKEIFCKSLSNRVFFSEKRTLIFGEYISLNSFKLFAFTFIPLLTSIGTISAPYCITKSTSLVSPLVQ